MITDSERAANNGHVKTVYEINRMLSKEKRDMPTAIKDNEGKILCSQEERKRRWKRALPKNIKPIIFK